MPDSRIFSFLLVLFAVLSSTLTWSVKSSDECTHVAVSVVEEAERAVFDAYGIILEAEEAGANVSALLESLDAAVQYLALAKVYLRTGDFDGAVTNASLCVEALDTIVYNATVLRNTTVRESGRHGWITVSGSVVAVGTVACACWLGWRFFQRRYHQRVLEMKPEVVEHES